MNQTSAEAYRCLLSYYQQLATGSNRVVLPAWFVEYRYALPKGYLNPKTPSDSKPAGGP